MKYMVSVKVNGKDYMTSIDEQSANAAEHFFLDRGVAGTHEYGVDGAMAYDAKMMKTDTFIGDCLYSTHVTLTDLLRIIESNNDRIERKDEAEQKMREMMKKVEELAKELEAAKAECNAAKDEYNRL